MKFNRRLFYEIGTGCSLTYASSRRCEVSEEVRGNVDEADSIPVNNEEDDRYLRSEESIFFDPF